MSGREGLCVSQEDEKGGFLLRKIFGTQKETTLSLFKFGKRWTGKKRKRVLRISMTENQWAKVSWTEGNQTPGLKPLPASLSERHKFR